jgi:hypothetical protein
MRWKELSFLVSFIAGSGALLRSLARCWVIALVFAALMYLFAANDQGREGLLTAIYETPALFLYMIGFIALMTAYILARLRVEAGRPPASDVTEVFAREAAPQLVAIMCAFSLPLWLGYAGTDGLQRDPNVRSFSAFFITIALLSVFFGRLLDEFDRPNSPLRDRLARMFSVLLAACGAMAGSLLQLPAWVVASITAIGLLVGAAIGARQAIRCATIQANEIARTVGFGIAFAGLGLLAAWNHAKDPVVAIGTEAGPFLAVLLIVAGWLGLAFFVVLAYEGLRMIRPAAVRRTALVIAGGAVVASIAMFLTGPYNEAAVETALPTAQSDANARSMPSLDQHAEAWLQERTPAIRAVRDRYPVIVVTAEGGGIRAAYWSATVLAGLHDALPSFSDHLFAVSGVSGGSVGASVYVALVHRQLTEPASCGTTPGMTACAAAVLGADLLSAPLLGTLVGDILRSTFRSDYWPDRARILDGVLAAAWQKAAGSNHMTRPFDTLWNDGVHATAIPLLTPNATSATDGRRTVLTPMARRSTTPSDADWHSEFGHSLSLASATLVSARFPLISPTALLSSSTANLRLVDGGYADNSGAATALDLLRILIDAAEKRGLAQKIMPVVLVIRNSPESTLAKSKTGGVRGQFAGTLLDPVFTLDSVRALLAERYLAELSRFINDYRGVVETRLQLRHEMEPYALGWMLSKMTRSRIDLQRMRLLSEVSSDLRVLLSPANAGASNRKMP